MAEENDAPDRHASDDEEFEKLLREMEKIVGEAFRDSFDDLKSGKTFIKGFSVRLGPDGDPHIDNYQADIHPRVGAAPEFGETDRCLSITLELPPVLEEDVMVDVKEQQVEVKVQGREDLHHVINLPQPIVPESAAITCKNRVLDIELDKLL